VNLKGKTFRASICKVAWWATVYHVWLQRNNKIFYGESKTEEQIVKAIRMDVKARMKG
jgi:hypothetical protein